MNIRLLSRSLGIVSILIATSMLFPITVGIYYSEGLSPAMRAFIITFFILVLIAFIFSKIKPKNKNVYAKEGYVIVALSWVLLSVFGALPFYFSGAFPSFIDALFESASGFTTVGATILTNLDSLPKSLLFWRSFTQWIGGIGVLVFIMAIIPLFGGRSMHIMRAETSGPIVKKMVPQMKQSAKITYIIYLAMTLLLIFLLHLGDLNWFESILTAFAVAGTGGFSITSAPIPLTPYLEWVLAIFMILFGINFNLYFLLVIRKFSDVFKNLELRVYLCIIAVATLFISGNLFFYSIQHTSIETSLRLATFQVSSIISSTGFSIPSFNAWPQLSRFILLILMFVGGCAGSTTGGLKVSRFILIFKVIHRHLKSMTHPRLVSSIKMEKDHPVEEGVLRNLGIYIMTYLLVLFISLILLSMNNLPTDVTLSSVITCLNSVGPDFGIIEPLGNLSNLTSLSKIVLIFDMLLGRLEIFPILLLFAPSTWKAH